MEVNEKFLAHFTDFIFLSHSPENADIIFIPGDGYPQMGEKAASLWKEGYAPYILPSGRYSVLQGAFSGVKDRQDRYPGRFLTEWEFLEQVLEQQGVPRKVILREDRATFTYENAIFSREVTERRGMEIHKAILCCKSFHARRCLMYYQLLYPDTEFLVCPVDVCGITRENWFLTPEGIETVLGEVARCGSQFHNILTDSAVEYAQNIYGNCESDK